MFYPDGLPQRRELEFSASRFPTIEINGSFYSLQRPEHYESWYRRTPPGFVFAVKGSRYITHMLRLRNVEKPLANFFASGILSLRDKTGPFLWQLAPTLACDLGTLDAFFERLPRTRAQALTLARRRDARMTGRSRLAVEHDGPLRHAIEVRHPSFVCRDFVSLAERHGVAIVVADTAGKWPAPRALTADFVYVRLHGDVELYTSGYSEEALEGWARRVTCWAADGRDVYVYFDNDVKVRAPFDALSLMAKLGLGWTAGPVAGPRVRPSGRRRRAPPQSGRGWTRKTARRAPLR